MKKRLQNGWLAAEVSTRGAELLSIYSLNLQREYLWQGAPESWSGHSLLLFPAAGRIDRSRILIHGREYPMPMHGFAKDMEFAVSEEREDFLALELSDSEETRRMFPYPFRFRVEFFLDGDRLVEQFRIANTGAEDMFFSFGAHPGFFCPIVLGEDAEDYILRFDQPQNAQKIVLEPHTRLCTPGREPFLDGSAAKPLSENFFDDGPILAEGFAADWVELRSLRSGNFMRMGIEGFPYMTLWGPPHRMSLICIEPWCGLSDDAGTDHVWETKTAGNRLSPGEEFIRRLWFRPGCELAKEAHPGSEK